MIELENVDVGRSICNGTYPILKVYPVYGLTTAFLSLGSLLGSFCLAWNYRPSYYRRYSTLLFAAALADSVHALSLIYQVFLLLVLSHCDGRAATYALTLNIYPFFAGTSYYRPVRIGGMVYEAALASSLLSTLLLSLLPLLRSLGQQCTLFLSTLLSLGYPILWTTLTLTLPDRDITLPSLAATYTGLLLLKTATVRLRCGGGEGTVGRWHRFEDRPGAFSGLSTFILVTHGPMVLWRVGGGQVVSAYATTECEVLLYCLLVKVLPLCGTFKVVSLLEEDEQFARRLQKALSRTCFKWVLCLGGVELVN